MTNQEIAQGQAEPSVPTLAVSPEVPVGASASGGFNEDELVSKIVARLAPEIDKRVQSVKDKRLSALDKLGGVDDLLALKDYIKAKNGDVDAAVREMRIDQVLSGQSASPAPAGTGAAVEAPSDIKEWTAEVLNEAGISFEDPEYKALAGERVATRAEWDRKLTRFVAKRNKQGVTPGAASAVGDGGGATPAAGSKDAQLNSKYARLRELQVMAPSLQINQEMKKVEGEIRALGGFV